MCQMIPITGMDIYVLLRAANKWTESFLPNAIVETSEAPENGETSEVWMQKLLELPLRGKFGDRLERWFMKSQLRIIARRGFSDEADFTADVCQANFHSHRQWTHEAFQEKLKALDAVRGVEIEAMQSPRTAIGAHR
jgi:hypothetical protein